MPRSSLRAAPTSPYLHLRRRRRIPIHSYEEHIKGFLNRVPGDADRILLTVPLVHIHQLLPHHYFVVDAISPIFDSGLLDDTWVALRLGTRGAIEYTSEVKLQEGTVVKLVNLGLHCASKRKARPMVFGVLRKPYHRELGYFFFNLFVHLVHCVNGVTSIATRTLHLAVPDALTLSAMKNTVEILFEKMIRQVLTFQDGELQTLAPLWPWEKNKGWKYPEHKWWHKCIQGTKE